jgi:hypothetical protein
MKKHFHIKIQVKNTKVDTLFNSSSQDKHITVNLVSNLGLEVHDHPRPYPLGCVNKDEQIKVMKECKIKFVVSPYLIDEVELYVVPLDVCGVVFGSPYMHMRGEIFTRRENQYYLIKDGKSFIINAYKGKSDISTVTANQEKN